MAAGGNPLREASQAAALALQAFPGRVPSEALHRLRVALRQLQSRLPRDAATVAVHRALREVLRASSPLRDRDVLLAELRRLGMTAVARAYAAEQAAARAAFAAGPALAGLQAALAALPPPLAAATTTVPLRKPLRRLARQLQAPVFEGTADAMAGSASDWHGLRLAVKKCRYALGRRREAAWQPPLAALLRRLQDGLGRWHDREQWLAVAAQDARLAPAVAQWQQEAARELAVIRPLLPTLARLVAQARGAS